MATNKTAALISGYSKEVDGQANYSYNIPMQRLKALLGNTLYIKSPESIPANGNYKNLSVLSKRINNAKLHITFRSFEDLVPVIGRYNICHVAWEFLHVSDSQIPFEDQVRMLNTFDEVWVPNKFSDKIFKKHGVLSKVTYVPTPIPQHYFSRKSVEENVKIVEELPCIPLYLNHHTSSDVNFEISKFNIKKFGEQSKLKNLNKDNVFLTVANVGDSRKNWDSLIKGFIKHNEQNPESILIIATLSQQPSEEIIYNTLRLKMKNVDGGLHSDSIYIIPGYKTDLELNSLYELCGYYLCTSYGEGQNLPLCEAMAKGVVPVTVKHTAMSDYISASNSILIPSKRCKIQTTQLGLSRFHSNNEFSTFYCSPDQVYEALSKSKLVDKKEYTKKSISASNTIKNLFSETSVKSRINKSVWVSYA